MKSHCICNGSRYFPWQNAVGNYILLWRSKNKVAWYFTANSLHLQRKHRWRCCAWPCFAVGLITWPCFVVGLIAWPCSYAIRQSKLSFVRHYCLYYQYRRPYCYTVVTVATIIYQLYEDVYDDWVELQDYFVSAHVHVSITVRKLGQIRVGES